MRRPDLLLVVNGVAFPTPDEGFEIIEATNVDAGRNVNGVVVGQIVGRNIWKINNLKWSNLDAQSWAEMKSALAPFYVTVSFTDDVGVRHTTLMYPGDRTSTPMHVSGYNYTKFKSCSFNLIDCGK